jgi:hypothetical protein
MVSVAVSYLGRSSSSNIFPEIRFFTQIILSVPLKTILKVITTLFIVHNQRVITCCISLQSGSSLITIYVFVRSDWILQAFDYPLIFLRFNSVFLNLSRVAKQQIESFFVRVCTCMYT